MLAFLRATRTGSGPSGPDAQVLVDAMVPELGCLRDYGVVRRNLRPQQPAPRVPEQAIDTVSTYLRAGLVDRLDLSIGLLSASAYHDRGLTLARPTARSGATSTRSGWSAMTWLQARKALAMDGGWTGTRRSGVAGRGASRRRPAGAWRQRRRHLDLAAGV